MSCLDKTTVEIRVLYISKYHDSATQPRLPITGFCGLVFSKWTVSLSLFGSVLVGINFKHV